MAQFRDRLRRREQGERKWREREAGRDRLSEVFKAKGQESSCMKLQFGSVL